MGGNSRMTPCTIQYTEDLKGAGVAVHRPVVRHGILPPGTLGQVLHDIVHVVDGGQHDLLSLAVQFHHDLDEHLAGFKLFFSRKALASFTCPRSEATCPSSDATLDRRSPTCAVRD